MDAPRSAYWSGGKSMKIPLPSFYAAVKTRSRTGLIWMTTHQVTGLSYLPRQDGLYYKSGIGQYEIYVSADGVNWGTAVATGTWTSSATEKTATFASASGRYVRLKALTEADNIDTLTSAVEINLTGQ